MIHTVPQGPAAGCRYLHRGCSSSIDRPSAASLDTSQLRTTPHADGYLPPSARSRRRVLPTKQAHCANSQSCSLANLQLLPSNVLLVRVYASVRCEIASLQMLYPHRLVCGCGHRLRVRPPIGTTPCIKSIRWLSSRRLRTYIDYGPYLCLIFLGRLL
jgi:hypothetical protein